MMGDKVSIEIQDLQEQAGMIVRLNDPTASFDIYNGICTMQECPRFVTYMELDGFKSSFARRER